VSTTQPDNQQSEERGGGFRRRALVGTIAAAVVFITALTLAGDVSGVADALRGFDWKLVPIILGLTLWNYAWRFVKWSRFLRALDVPSSGLKLDVLIYLSGFSMSVTPGKVGELIRSIFIRRLHGTPVNNVAAALAAERIADAVAMLILALIGLLEFNYGRPFVALAVVGFAIGISILRHPLVLHRLLDRATRFPRFDRPIVHARAFLDASGTLFAPRLFTKAVGIGVISWTGECLAFFFVLNGLGMDATWTLFLSATFILAVSSLAGGVSLLPGGLGVTDATVAGMLVLLVDDPSMNRAVAAAATLIIRFATLWFAVLIGAIALAAVQRMLKGRAEPLPATD
jgi:uncharacterized protein (TIRG00374 family)